MLITVSQAITRFHTLIIHSLLYIYIYTLCTDDAPLLYFSIKLFTCRQLTLVIVYFSFAVVIRDNDYSRCAYDISLDDGSHLSLSYNQILLADGIAVSYQRD